MVFETCVFNAYFIFSIVGTKVECDAEEANELQKDIDEEKGDRKEREVTSSPEALPSLGKENVAPEKLKPKKLKKRKLLKVI